MMMWKWIRSWFRTKDQFYSERDRHLFQYWNGSRYVRVDPLEVDERLRSVPGFDLYTDLRHARLMDPMVQHLAEQSRARILEATRFAFRLEPYRDEGNGKEVGLSRAKTFGVLLEYARWVDALKKNTTDYLLWSELMGEPFFRENSATKSSPPSPSSPHREEQLTPLQQPPPPSPSSLPETTVQLMAGPMPGCCP